MVTHRAAPTRSRVEQGLLKSVVEAVQARLKQSLHLAIYAKLSREEQPQQRSRLWGADIQVGENPAEPIPENVTILDIFDRKDIEGKLFILGQPGVGKTITLSFGLNIGLHIWLLVGLSLGLMGAMVGALYFGLMGAMMGLMIGALTGVMILWLSVALSGGLSTVDIEEKSFPKQRLKQSFQVEFKQFLTGALILGLIGGLHGGLSSALMGALSFALPFGFIIGLDGTLRTCIDHLILRIVLYQNGYIPWNYAGFLDHCADRLLIQQVGGRYRFMHKLLQERFAALLFEPP